MHSSIANMRQVTCGCWPGVGFRNKMLHDVAPRRKWKSTLFNEIQSPCNIAEQMLISHGLLSLQLLNCENGNYRQCIAWGLTGDWIAILAPWNLRGKIILLVTMPYLNWTVQIYNCGRRIAREDGEISSTYEATQSTLHVD